MKLIILMHVNGLCAYEIYENSKDLNSTNVKIIFNSDAVKHVISVFHKAGQNTALYYHEG
jgi:hypothetical protein